MRKVQINSRKFKAVIFDLDGTMIDNIPYHFRAYKEVSKSFGVDITEKFFYQNMSGRTNREILSRLLGVKDPKKIHKYAVKKEIIYRKIYRPNLKEIPGLKKFIGKLKSKNIKVALATSAPKKNVKFVLSKLKLLKSLDVITTGQDIKRGKPSPEIYLTTAKKLRIKPKNCLVFEDANNGIRSAKAAGMEVVAVLSGKTKKYNRFRGQSVSNFTQINLK